MRTGPAPAAGTQGGPGGHVVVIGVGNEFRRDDGAGPAVIRRLCGRVPGHVELSALAEAVTREIQDA